MGFSQSGRRLEQSLCFVGGGSSGIDLWTPLALPLAVVAYTKRQEEKGRPGTLWRNIVTLVSLELSFGSTWRG